MINSISDTGYLTLGIPTTCECEGSNFVSHLCFRIKLVGKVNWNIKNLSFVSKSFVKKTLRKKNSRLHNLKVYHFRKTQ